MTLLPREKLLKIGAGMLTTSELLAIILNTGTKGINVLKLAKRIEKIIFTYKSDMQTLKFHLSQVKGIGPAQVSKLIAIVELSHRFNMQYYAPLTKPEDIYQMFLHITTHKQEEFFVIALNAQYYYKSHTLLYKGNRGLISITPTEIFTYLFKQESPYFILVHNHPGGNVLPSTEDVVTTQKLVTLSNLIGLRLIDHIIISSKGTFFSFSKENLLKPYTN